MTRTLIPRALATAAAALALAVPAHAAAAPPAPATAASVPDAAFRACLNAALGQSPTAPVTTGQLAGLDDLECPLEGPGVIGDLTGAQHLTGLDTLRVAGHRVRDVSALAGLAGLRDLDLTGNAITDAAALAPLAAGGTRLHLAAQSVTASGRVGEELVLPAARDGLGTPVVYDRCLVDDYADVPVDCSAQLGEHAGVTTLTPAVPGYHAVLAPGWGADGFSLAVEVTAEPVQQFTDVPLDHVFFREVSWTAVRGITRGYADGRFGAAHEITRGQAAAFLYRLAGEPEVDLPERSPFSDVSPTHDFYPAVLWLREQQVTRGYADGRFGLADGITRGEMAAFLHRYEGSPTDQPLPVESPFGDVPAGHEFYRAITWLSAEGITRGYASGDFGLDDPVTRGQAAAFLYRLEHPARS